jgi:hypothetical protein
VRVKVIYGRIETIEEKLKEYVMNLEWKNILHIDVVPVNAVTNDKSKVDVAVFIWVTGL